MKNSSISFYKILMPAILIVEFLLLFVAYLYLNLNIPVIIFIGLLILPLTAFTLVKQYSHKINIPQPIFLIGCGFTLEMAISPIRGYVGMQESAAGGFTILLIASFLIIRKNSHNINPYLIMLYLLIGVSFLQFPVRIFNFTKMLISLPDYLVHLLGVIAGLFLYQREKILQKINLSVSVLLVLFVYFYGYNLWMNKLDYGSFSGKVYIKVPANPGLRNINDAVVNLKKGKFTVMDFWFTRCGACFDAFPEFQKYYNRYKNNPNVQFYTVNQPLSSENAMDSFKLLTQIGYTFPMVATGHDKALTTALNIHAYPTTIVVDGQGFVIYKGSLEGAISALQSHL